MMTKLTSLQVFSYIGILSDFVKLSLEPHNLCKMLVTYKEVLPITYKQILMCKICSHIEPKSYHIYVAPSLSPLLTLVYRTTLSIGHTNLSLGHSEVAIFILPAN